MSSKSKPVCPLADLDPIEIVYAPIYHNYHATSSRAMTPFLHAIKRGELLGHLSTATGKVLFPPLGACPESGEPTSKGVVLADSGTVISFTTVHLPIPGSKLIPPFIVANILLDGADQTCGHLVSECEPGDVAMGMRVKAVWRQQEEWGHGLENIEYFKPTGEELVDIDQLKADCLAKAEHRKQRCEKEGFRNA